MCAHASRRLLLQQLFFNLSLIPPRQCGVCAAVPTRWCARAGPASSLLPHHRKRRCCVFLARGMCAVFSTVRACCARAVFPADVADACACTLPLPFPGAAGASMRLLLAPRRARARHLL